GPRAEADGAVDDRRARSGALREADERLLELRLLREGGSARCDKKCSERHRKRRRDRRRNGQQPPGHEAPRTKILQGENAVRLRFRCIMLRMRLTPARSAALLLVATALAGCDRNGTRSISETRTASLPFQAANDMSPQDRYAAGMQMMQHGRG